MVPGAFQIGQRIGRLANFIEQILSGWAERGRDREFFKFPFGVGSHLLQVTPQIVPQIGQFLAPLPDIDQFHGLGFSRGIAADCHGVTPGSQQGYRTKEEYDNAATDGQWQLTIQ